MLGVHLTIDQLRLYAAANNDAKFQAKLDFTKFNTLFQAYMAATDGPAQDAAARPLLEEVRTLTAQELAARHDQVAAIRAVFTPEQWAILGIGD